MTERAAFELTADGFLLTEIAEGVDLQREVLDRIGFAVAISPQLRPMHKALFADGPMGLRAMLLAHGPRPKGRPCRT